LSMSSLLLVSFTVSDEKVNVLVLSWCVATPVEQDVYTVKQNNK